MRDDLPLTVYHQSLPHWRQDGATYFVTFRLADSLARSRLQELRAFKVAWQRENPAKVLAAEGAGMPEELAREVMRRVEGWLDRGMGSCALREPEASAAVADALHRHDGETHELGCYVVMPNHVHVVVRPLVPRPMPLERLLRLWKGGAAREVNELLGRSGTLWQRESFDRIVRDEEHLWRAIQYVGRNPGNAGLANTNVRLWIRPSWVECGWKFERRP